MAGNRDNTGDGVLTLDDVLERIRTAPPLRKIKALIDRTALSADMKALLYEIAQISVRVGDAVVALGRRLLDLALGIVRRFPNMTLGLVVAVVLVTLLGVASLPVVGGFLTQLLVLLGMTQGAIEDLRQGALAAAMVRVQEEFAPLRAKA